MEANAKEADKYKLKEKAYEFFTAGKSTKKAKKTVTDPWSEAEFDRAYVSGHDSLSEEEAEHVIPQVYFFTNTTPLFLWNIQFC